VNGVFQSMGQVVMASQNMLSEMKVGDFVTYVPGATEVFVTGLLSSVDYFTGTARMGGLTIDYTSGLGDGAAPTSAMWSFSGIRPGVDGVMVSDQSGIAK
jgi:hypothetical protein